MIHRYPQASLCDALCQNIPSSTSCNDFFYWNLLTLSIYYFRNVLTVKCTCIPWKGFSLKFSFLAFSAKIHWYEIHMPWGDLRYVLTSHDLSISKYSGTFWLIISTYWCSAPLCDATYMDLQAHNSYDWTTTSGFAQPITHRGASSDLIDMGSGFDCSIAAQRCLPTLLGSPIWTLLAAWHLWLAVMPLQLRNFDDNISTSSSTSPPISFQRFCPLIFLYRGYKWTTGEWPYLVTVAWGRPLLRSRCVPNLFRGYCSDPDFSWLLVYLKLLRRLAFFCS